MSKKSSNGWNVLERLKNKNHNAPLKKIQLKKTKKVKPFPDSIIIARQKTEWFIEALRCVEKPRYSKKLGEEDGHKGGFFFQDGTLYGLVREVCPVRLLWPEGKPTSIKGSLKDGHKLLLEIDLRFPKELIKDLTSNWVDMFSHFMKTEPNQKRVRGKSYKKEIMERCFHTYQLRQEGNTWDAIVTKLYDISKEDRSYKKRYESVIEDYNRAQEWIAKVK